MKHIGWIIDAVLWLEVSVALPDAPITISESHFHLILEQESISSGLVPDCSVDFRTAWSPLCFGVGEVGNVNCCERESQRELRQQRHINQNTLSCYSVSVHTCCSVFPFIICSCYMNTCSSQLPIFSYSTVLWFVRSNFNSPALALSVLKLRIVNTYKNLIWNNCWLWTELGSSFKTQW